MWNIGLQGHRAKHNAQQQHRSNVGAVEPQRGCEGGGTGNTFIAWPTAFAASLKLDSSHRGSAVHVEYRFAGPSRQAQCSTTTPLKMWELSSPSEAAMAAAQSTSSSPDPPLSQPR